MTTSSRHPSQHSDQPPTNEVASRRLIAAGILLGIGLGGFIDGILFHQLLQLHNMLSARFPVRGVDAQTLVVNLEINMFWDGMFHVLCWIMTAIGLGLFWHTSQSWNTSLPASRFIGTLSLGWGLFNLVEGIINHHILHLHHVTETPNHLIWDLTFLASGVALSALGWWLVYPDRRGQPSNPH